MKLVWLRRDLRIHDNPALYEASLAKQGVIALHISTPKTWKNHHLSLVQQDWMNQNLDKLQTSLTEYNIPLLRTATDYFSECPKIILDLIKQYNITALYFNEEYAWDERKRDHNIIAQLKSANIPTYTFHDQCIIPPHVILNKQEKPYVVFTPYKKTCLDAINLEQSLLIPRDPPLKQPNTCMTSTHLCPSTPDHDQDISWLKPGSDAGLTKLKTFLEHKIYDYEHLRDQPSVYGTSCLSPYLALGVISVRQCFAHILNTTTHQNLNEVILNKSIASWISELIWRDFYKMICFNYPSVSRNQPFKRDTNAIKWSDNQEHLKAWQTGKTGVPIVDAAMRQLNQYGWMHNRLRMITAMYLTKNLWIDWREGEAYFASKLVDWDFSSNNGGWQWSASTGTDAAPYFRIFNPVHQSKRFDPHGKFIRQYCPELHKLNDKTIHDPPKHEAAKLNYPPPLVDLKRSRANAIERFKHILKGEKH